MIVNTRHYRPPTLVEMIHQNPAVLVLTVLFGLLVVFMILLWLDTGA